MFLTGYNSTVIPKQYYNTASSIPLNYVKYPINKFIYIYSMFAQFLISGGLSFIKNLQTLPGLQTLMRYTSGGARKGAKSPVLWGRARTLRCQMLQCIGKSLLKNVKILGKYEKSPNQVEAHSWENH
jgi:hypothetical protein